MKEYLCEAEPAADTGLAAAAAVPVVIDARVSGSEEGVEGLRRRDIFVWKSTMAITDAQ